MPKKQLPFNQEQVGKLLKDYPSVYIIDEKGYRSNLIAMNNAFSWADHRNFIAVKSIGNPTLVDIARQEKNGSECASETELAISKEVGLTGKDVIFHCHNPLMEDWEKAVNMGTIINFDDLGQALYYMENFPLPEEVCFRYLPKELPEGMQESWVMGDIKNSKFGDFKENIRKGYKIMKGEGVKNFGIHAMLAGNVLDTSHFGEQARILFKLIIDYASNPGVDIKYANLGGGLGIPYTPDKKPLDLVQLSDAIFKAYKDIIGNDTKALKIYTEAGRYPAGTEGYFATTVTQIKKTHKRFAKLNTSSAEFIRPAIFNAFHDVVVIGKDGKLGEYDLTGSICENRDKLAIDRPLPELEPNDIIVFFDAGAHCRSQGYNYCGKLRPAEFLLKEDGTFEMIGKAETVKDNLRRFVFDGSRFDFKDYIK